MRWIIAWALYWLGHWTSELLDLVPDDDRWECTARRVYRVYNRLMVASMRAQGDGEGPWGPLRNG